MLVLKNAGVDIVAGSVHLRAAGQPARITLLDGLDLWRETMYDPSLCWETITF